MMSGIEAWSDMFAYLKCKVRQSCQAYSRQLFCPDNGLATHQFRYMMEMRIGIVKSGCSVLLYLDQW